MQPPDYPNLMPGFILVPVHLVATPNVDWSQLQQVYQAAYEQAQATEWRSFADRLQPIWN
jgi:hypothetical protein